MKKLIWSLLAVVVVVGCASDQLPVESPPAPTPPVPAQVVPTKAKPVRAQLKSSNTPVKLPELVVELPMTGSCSDDYKPTAEGKPILVPDTPTRNPFPGRVAEESAGSSFGSQQKAALDEAQQIWEYSKEDPKKWKPNPHGEGKVYESGPLHLKKPK